METTFYCVKNLSGAGSKTILNFIKLFQNKFAEKIKKYISNRIVDGDDCPEPPFFYSEQQTKTYITAVLDQITETNFMQEFPVERKKYNPREGKKPLHNGRVDYWCRFGGNKKISVFMEIKQSWIEYHSQKKEPNFNKSIKLHSEAAGQLENITNKISFDNSYGLALSIVPLFTKYESNSEKPAPVKKELIEGIAEDARRKTKADAYGYIIIPLKYRGIVWFEDKNSKKNYENYPGVVFLWTIRKYT